MTYLFPEYVSSSLESVLRLLTRELFRCSSGNNLILVIKSSSLKLAANEDESDSEHKSKKNLEDIFLDLSSSHKLLTLMSQSVLDQKYGKNHIEVECIYTKKFTKQNFTS